MTNILGIYAQTNTMKQITKNIKYKATKQLYKLRQEIFTSHNPLLHSADSVFTHFSISVMLHSAFTTMVSHHSERSYF